MKKQLLVSKGILLSVIILIAGLGIMQTGCTMSQPVVSRQGNIKNSQSESLSKRSTSIVKSKSVNARSLNRPGSFASIKIFLIDEKGKALSSIFPGIMSARIKRANSAAWDAPITVSNQNTPPDFTGTLVQSFAVDSRDKAAIGVYVPVGFKVLKKINEEQNCTWEQTGVPYNKSAYELYASAFSDRSSQDTLFVNGLSSGTKCLAFMLVNNSSEYKTYGKIDPDLFGKYHENAFSSAMGLRNIPANKITTLSLSNSNSSEVTIEASHTLGGMIQALYLKKDVSQERMQLIQNNDAADSGVQWSMILNNISFSNDPYRTTQKLLFNQAVGADPTWMWGMEMLLFQPTLFSLKTKENLWTPLYAEHNSDQPVLNQHDKTGFFPRSSLFRPQAVHLFDGRVEDVSLKNIILPNGHSVSRVSTTFHSRAHLLQSFSANFSRIEWMAFRRDLLVAHNAVIYYGDATGSHRLGKLDEQWEGIHPKCVDNKASPPVVLAYPCGRKRLSNANSVSIVLDPGTTLEQVLSIHLPDFTPFASDSLVGFTSSNFHITSFAENRRRNSTFLFAPKFSNFEKKSYNFTKDYDVYDTIQISIGSNSDLKKINPSLGY